MKTTERNLLFILTDQQQRDALGCMGNPNIETPHLDQLAREGVLFRRCYSNNPICTPFRGSLLTGQYTSRCGVMENNAPLPAGVPTFADAFNRAGYATSWIGKWHLGGHGNGPIARDLQGGFERFRAYQCYNGFYRDVCFYDREGNESRFDEHRTDVTTRLAIEELEALAEGNHPFLLMVSYQAPHYPVQPAPEFAARYKNRTIKHRPNCTKNIDPHTPTGSPPSPRPVENDPDYQRYGNDLDEYIRLYNAMCTQIDANLGRLFEVLNQKDLAENTLVIFTSDHGDMQGSHGLKNKSLPYEESAGIPLIVKGPGIPGGRVSDGLVSGIDFMPTCMDWAGINPLAGLDGQSMVPFLRGETEATRDAVFSENIDGWCMIVRGGWKLAAERGGRALVPTLMFHLDDDPCELRNRIDDPTVEALRNELLADLSAWDADVRSGPVADARVKS